MTKIQQSAIRQLSIHLLDDKNGISEEAYNELVPLMVESGNEDLFDFIGTQDGRVFIHEVNDKNESYSLTKPEAAANCCEGGPCLCSAAA